MSFNILVHTGDNIRELELTLPALLNNSQRIWVLLPDSAIKTFESRFFRFKFFNSLEPLETIIAKIIDETGYPVLLVKAGEFLDSDFPVKFPQVNEKNNIPLIKKPVSITYLDPLFPGVTRFENRMFGDDINNFTDNHLVGNLLTVLPIPQKAGNTINHLNQDINILFEYITKNPTRSEYFSALGINLIANKEYPQALRIFQTYLEMVITDGIERQWVLIYQSLLQVFMGNIDLGRQGLMNPSNILVIRNFQLIWLSQLYIQENNTNQAILKLMKVRTSEVESPQFDLVLSQMQTGWSKEYLKYLSNRFKPLIPPPLTFNIAKNISQITAMLAIKNEEKYIGRVLQDLSEYVDSIVILDDASTDRTREIVKSFSKVKRIIDNPIGTERHEGRDRNRLFQLAKELESGWFLCLDGDEIFENRMKNEIHNLIHNYEVDGYWFQMFHFWRGETHYRTDGLWKNQFRLKLFRNRQDYTKFENKKLHVQTIPINISEKSTKYSDIRLKHLGYADFGDTKRKYAFYEKEDNIKDPKEIGNSDYSHLVNETNLELELWEE